MITKRDYLIGGIVGFLTALFLMPVLWNLERLNIQTVLIAFIAIPICWAFGVWLGGYLSRFFSFFAQFGKYATVGFLNASINFGVSNLLSAFTGITSGFIFGGLNVPGFLFAATNSYFWNEMWVFKRSEESQQAVGVNRFADFPKFMAVTILGAVLNSLVIIYITTYVHPFFGLDVKVWDNIALVIASAFVLMWNFVGYKFFAFK